MYIVILTSILAILLTYLEIKKGLVGGMKWGFIFLTILGCIHYDYGNDYMAYLNTYNDIVRYPFDLGSVLSGESFREPGWVLLCYGFKYFGGFFVMVAVLNIIQNILVFKTIKKYVEKQWWMISIFIYAFFTSFYLMSFSMMRQSFVIYVFLGIWPLIEKKKSLLVCLILYLCSTVHSSALILLPFSFLGYVPIRRSKWLALTFIVFYFSLWLAGSFINEVFSLFMKVEKFGKYAETYGNSDLKVTFGIGFLLNQIPFILSLYYLLCDSNETSHSDKALVCLSIISFVIIPFASLIPLVGRIGLYFGAYQMIAIPKIYSNLKNIKIRYAALFILIFMTLYDYFLFFKSPIWVAKYTTFKTIFPELF